MSPRPKIVNARKPLPALVTLSGCVLVSLFCLIYPLYVIRPFRHQGVHELMAALFVLRFRPIVMGLCVAFAIAALAVILRSKPRFWRGFTACAACACVCALGALSRLNIYELMFHPIDHPEFESAKNATLAASEKVLAIQVAGLSRAYPIRIISYHHIVNDVAGGVPVVATY
jgi:hypothetical protein